MGFPIDETTILALFPVLFLGLWLLIVILLSRMSGWVKLQDRFPDRSDQSLIVMRAQSGAMGGVASAKVNFSGCLRLDVCRTGLRGIRMENLRAIPAAVFCSLGSNQCFRCIDLQI